MRKHFPTGDWEAAAFKKKLWRKFLTKSKFKQAWRTGEKRSCRPTHIHISRSKVYQQSGNVTIRTVVGELFFAALEGLKFKAFLKGDCGGKKKVGICLTQQKNWTLHKILLILVWQEIYKYCVMKRLMKTSWLEKTYCLMNIRRLMIFLN